MAFLYEDDMAWVTLYFVFDFMFFIDCILSFFTTYKDEIKHEEVTNLYKIAVNYIKGWFAIDILSIIPFDLMMGL